MSFFDQVGAGYQTGLGNVSEGIESAYGSIGQGVRVSLIVGTVLTVIVAGVLGYILIQRVT